MEALVSKTKKSTTSGMFTVATSCAAYGVTVMLFSTASILTLPIFRILEIIFPSLVAGLLVWRTKWNNYTLFVLGTLSIMLSVRSSIVMGLVFYMGYYIKMRCAVLKACELLGYAAYTFLWLCLAVLMGIVSLFLPIVARLLIASISLVVGLYFALVQPFSSEMYKRVIHLEREENEKLRSFLSKRLGEGYKRPLVVRMMCTIVRPFFSHKVVGCENVRQNMRNIFVSNHKEIYGPLVMAMFFPFEFRSWSTVYILDTKLSTDTVYHGTFERIKWIPECLKMFLSRVSAYLVAKLIGAFDPIVVYNDCGKSLLKTISESVDSIQTCYNLIVFPENPASTEENRYAKKGVCEFHTGFVRIAKEHYERTGEEIAFYPVYCESETRRIIIGESIVFDSSKPYVKERTRITSYLHDSINKIAQV